MFNLPTNFSIPLLTSALGLDASYGATGPRGPTGKTGSTGVQGSTGLQGPSGPPGAGITQISTGQGLTGGPITSSGTIELANTAVTPGVYGNSTQVPSITIDQQGRITSAARINISGGGGGGGGPVFSIKNYGAVGNTLNTEGWIPPSALVIGNHYVVKNTGGGSTDFTLVGSSSNTPGTAFIATGTTGGTGQAYVDDTFAIQSAIDAAAAVNGGSVYVPSGLWLTSGVSIPNTNNAAIAIVGEGPLQSVIQNFLVGPYAATPLIQWFTPGSSLMSDAAMSNIRVNATGNRSKNNPLVIFNGPTKVWMNNVEIDSEYDCVKLISSSLFAVNCAITSGTTDTDHSGCALRLDNSNINASNCTFSQNSWLSGELPVAPPVYLTGTSTSTVCSNVSVTGAGPRALYDGTNGLVAVSGSLGYGTAQFSVTPVFRKEDYIVLHGMSPSPWNAFARVIDITTGGGSTYVTFDTTGLSFPTSGSPTVLGSVMTVPAAVVVSNVNGPLNEGSWVGGILAAAGYPTTALSAGFYFDGRAGAGPIQGWAVSNVYIDVGRVGVLITGGSPDLSYVTSSRINLNNLIVEGNAGDGTSAKLGDIWIENTPGVVINGLVGASVVQDNTDERNRSIFAYSKSNPGYITCSGLSIMGSQVGGTADYYPNALNISKYGFYISGRLDTLTIVGNVFWGKTKAVETYSISIESTSIVTSSANHWYVGTSIPNSSDQIANIAAGASLVLPFNDVVNIAGTGTTSDIVGEVWCGRQVTLLVGGGITFSPTVNIRSSQTFPANSVVIITFDGTQWWVK